MSENRTRIDVDAFTDAFKQYLTIKYKMAHTRSEKEREKEALAKFRKFVKEVSQTAGNGHMFQSLKRRYNQMFADFESILRDEMIFSPGKIDSDDSPDIKHLNYPYSIQDIIAKTELNSDKPIRKWAKTPGAVDCINLNEKDDGNDIFRFSEQGIKDLLILIKPRPKS